MYTLVGYGNAGIPFFFQMNQDFLYNVVMSGCACTVGEMNAMLTGVFLNKIRFGGGGSVMVWAAIAHGYRSPLVIIKWVFFNPYHTWSKFLPVTVNLWP